MKLAVSLLCCFLLPVAAFNLAPSRALSTTLSKPALAKRALAATTMGQSSEAANPASPADGIDWAQMAKYPVATIGEFSIIAALFKSIDTLVTLPTIVVPFIFLFLSLRSRIFSFLPASRPPRGGFENEEGKPKAPVRKEVKRPAWTPPGIAFPFIWLTISVLRASSSTLIWRTCGKTLFSFPLLVLVAHLCIGDTWNCITNIEQRLGFSALTVLIVLASVYSEVAVYFTTLPLAGYLLAPSAVWISIATVLTWTIWRMNEPNEPLLPKKGEGKNAQFRLPLSDVFEK